VLKLTLDISTGCYRGVDLLLLPFSCYIWDIVVSTTEIVPGFGKNVSEMSSSQIEISLSTTSSNISLYRGISIRLDLKPPLYRLNENSALMTTQISSKCPQEIRLWQFRLSRLRKSIFTDAGIMFAGLIHLIKTSESNHLMFPPIQPGGGEISVFASLLIGAISSCLLYKSSSFSCSSSESLLPWGHNSFTICDACIPP